MTDRAISQEHVEALKTAWGKAVVAADPDQVLALYWEDAVLKPTLSNAIRRTLDDIRLYFTGGDKYGDSGFLKNQFAEVRFVEGQALLMADVAVETGAYEFVRQDGSVVEAHYTFALQLDDSGQARIRTQHSSLKV